MDELDLLDRFRADAPGRANAVTPARAALMGTMASPRVRGTPILRLTPIRRGAWRRAWVVAVAAAVVAIALVAPALLPGGDETSAAAATLQSAARVAAEQPWSPLGPGQFGYTETRALWESTVGDDAPVLEEVLREIWIAPDGSGRIRETGRGDQAWSETFGPGGLHFEDLSVLPTDLDGLRAYVGDRASNSDNPLDYEMFVVIGDLLRETYASPELRAALYEVAGTLPRVELLGEITDESGRAGVGVGYTFLGVRFELIFDPDTSAVLGERYVLVDPPVVGASPPPGVGVNADGVDDPGTVLGWTVYLRSGIVDSVNERP